jgi:hypothetical protein
MRNPPPGATITAAPLALSGSGRNGVSVARETLRTKGSPHCLYQVSCAVWPSTPPVPSGMAFDSSGASIGVFGGSCANTVEAASKTRPTLMKAPFTKATMEPPSLTKGIMPSPQASAALTSLSLAVSSGIRSRQKLFGGR